jgi:hypothetical protein
MAGYAELGGVRTQIIVDFLTKDPVPTSPQSGARTRAKPNPPRAQQSSAQIGYTATERR